MKKDTTRPRTNNRIRVEVFVKDTGRLFCGATGQGKNYRHKQNKGGLLGENNLILNAIICAGSSSGYF
jgi:hypothetical protein